MPPANEILSYYAITGTGAIAIAAAAAVAWRAIWRGDPASRPARLGRPLLATLALGYFLLVLAFMLDQWWHISVGREHFWIPPHLLALLSLAVIAGSAAWAVRSAGTGRGERWLYSCLLFAAGFAVAFAFDDTIHDLFGQENISSALIILAPPHLALAVMLFLLGLAIAALFREQADRRNMRAEILFLSLLVLGAVISFAEYIARVFWPFVAYQVLGLWGAFAAVALVGFALALALKLLPRVFPSALMLSIVAGFLTQVRIITYRNPDVPLFSNFLPLPGWLIPLSLAAAALGLDMMRERKFLAKPAVAGAFYGAVAGALLYPLAAAWFAYRGFVPHPFAVPLLALIGLSAAGGAAGFGLADLCRRLAARVGRS